MAIAFGAAAVAAAGTVVLENGAAVVEITPSIGRITNWRLKHGENVLWNNTSGDLTTRYVPRWKNYGGDKVWLIPQPLRSSVFGNPAPDPVIDGQPWRVTAQSKYSVTIESNDSEELKCRVSRVVTLDETRPVMTVSTTVHRFAASPIPVHIWAVSQVKRPKSGRLDLAPDLYRTESRYWQSRVGRSDFKAEQKGDSLAISLAEKGWDKFHAYGRFVESIYSDVTFRQEFNPDADGAYPDRSTVQFYINEEYVEMECFSSLRHLKAGESMTLDVKWSLQPRGTWQQSGPGGGGRLMHLQPSPHDADKLLCAGDMGAMFHSVDGGGNWRMNDFEEAERVRYDAGCSPWEYVLSRPGEVWTGSKTRGLLRSCDYGVSWEAIPGPWDALTLRDWFHTLGPDLIRFAADGKTGLAGWGAFGDDSSVKLFVTRDGGDRWQELALSEGVEKPRILHFTSSAKALYFGVNRAYAVNLTEARVTELPVRWEGDVISSASGGESLFVVLKREDATTGLFETDGETGALTPIPFALDGRSPAISVVASDRLRGTTLYVGVRGQTGHPATIWKSIDRGRSWKEILFRKPGRDCNIDRDRWTTGRWGWSAPPWSIGVDWSNPEIVTFTDFTMCGLSRDGGKSWKILSSKPKERGATPGGGAPMLTGWNYLIDGDRHLASTTDFASWQSSDGGDSWAFYQPPPKAIWHNNIYEVAIDPANRERLFAAASLKHDLPYWHHLISQGRQPQLWRGGLLISEDGGRHWNAVKPETSKLPDLPITGLFMEPDGTLYAACMGDGVFRRRAGAEAFEPFSDGLPQENRNVFRVTRSRIGRLYAVVTAKWESEKANALPGGVFHYDETAARWLRLPLPAELLFPVNITFSEDGRRMLVACFQQWRERRKVGGGAYADPGLWLADVDGGNARKILDRVPVFEARFIPGGGGGILAGTVGRGLLRGSESEEFTRVVGCPPGSVHSVTFDPADPATVYLTTFGQGMWRGHL